MKTETASLAQEIERLEAEMERQSVRLAEMKRRLPREPVEEHVLAGWNGPVQLSELFGGKPDLIVVHNMGKGCRYCTLWADGLNGVWRHLADRAAFVLCSPDPPETQKEFARSRGWTMPMVSAEGSTFTEAMGFRSGNSWMPGVSTFQRTPTGGIFRVAKAPFGPFDPFCAAWPMIALLAEGVNEWEPQVRYEEPLRP